MQSNLLPTLKQIQALPSFLLSQREKLPSISAIYCVLQGEKVLYIGQTKNLNQRWRSHHRYPELKIIPNARLVWLPCPVEKLDELETHMIETLDPVLNGKKAPSNKMADRLSVDIEGLREAIQEAGKGVVPLWHELSLAQKIRMIISRGIEALQNDRRNLGGNDDKK